jgi:hypothetical protein
MSIDFHPYGEIIGQENLLHPPTQDIGPQFVGHGGHG